MRNIEEIKQNRKLKIEEIGEDGGRCFTYLPGSHAKAMIIFSWGGGWDHVSISYRNRCPSWEEMCAVMDIFFGPDECAVQYHPPEKDYVNRHPYCLHLWKPQGNDMPRPPKWMVG